MRKKLTIMVEEALTLEAKNSLSIIEILSAVKFSSCNIYICKLELELLLSITELIAVIPWYKYLLSNVRQTFISSPLKLKPLLVLKKFNFLELKGYKQTKGKLLNFKFFTLFFK